METKEALQIIENVINAAIQKGIFINIEDVTTAAIAFKTIQNAIEPKELKEDK